MEMNTREILMAESYKAVEATAPGTFRMIERPIFSSSALVNTYPTQAGHKGR
jgi:hypothetical protein